MVATTAVRGRVPVQLRLLGMASFGFAATGLYGALVAFLVGEFPGRRWWSPLQATPVIAVVGAWVWRYGALRLLADVAAHAVWMALGLWHPESALLSRSELRATMNLIAMPANFRRTGERARWSRAGHYENLTRHWIATGDSDEVLAQLRRALGDQRFVLGQWQVDPAEPSIATAEAVWDRYTLVLAVDSHRAFVDGHHEPIPPGHFGVTAVLTAK